MEMMEFVNNLFSLSYPAGWVCREHEDGSGVLLANSTLSRKRYRQGNPLLSGDQVLNLSLTPVDLFPALFISIQPEATVGELAEAILTKLGGINDAEVGLVEMAHLADGREVAMRKAKNTQAEGAVILWEVAEGILAMCTMAGFPGEFNAAEYVALAILSSLAFNSTAEALTAAINPAVPLGFMPE
jgi:hypothetical protein